MTTTLSATGLALRAGRGPVFGPIDADIDTPMGVITGARGSGKTCLLLTVAGRMSPSTGTVRVLGEHRPAAIRRFSAIAGFDGIDELEQSVTVGDALTERARWNAPWYRYVRAFRDADVHRALAPAFGDRPLPGARTMIWDLDEDEALLLRIALALLDGPRLLVVDDVDHVHDPAARAAVVDRLGALAASGITVILSAAGFEPELYAALPVEVQHLALTTEEQYA